MYVHVTFINRKGRSGYRDGQFSGQENVSGAVSREAKGEHFEHLLQP
jgi:hypothetical protein